MSLRHAQVRSAQLSAQLLMFTTTTFLYKNRDWSSDIFVSRFLGAGQLYMKDQSGQRAAGSGQLLRPSDELWRPSVRLPDHKLDTPIVTFRSQLKIPIVFLLLKSIAIVVDPMIILRVVFRTYSAFLIGANNQVSIWNGQHFLAVVGKLS